VFFLLQETTYEKAFNKGFIGVIAQSLYQGLTTRNLKVLVNVSIINSIECKIVLTEQLSSSHCISLLFTSSSFGLLGKDSRTINSLAHVNI